MHKRWCYWLGVWGMVMFFLLAGCGNEGNSPGVAQNTPAKTGSPLPVVPDGSPFSVGGINQTPTPTANELSSVSFMLNGGVTGEYVISTSTPTSKLRHGHKEFTIDVANAGMSIFIAFYGYHGPSTYMLSEDVNGGNVHINIEQKLASWDLSLRPKAECTLTITSDTPTMSAGIDRMEGTFFCPLLPSSSPTHPQQSVAVSKGHIDVAIIVES
jgi:hypothetical protein